MQRLQFLTHRGQRILLVDYSNCTADEVAEIADKAPLIITHEPPGSLLLLVDFTGAGFNKETVEHIKIAAAIDKAHIKRDACVLDASLPKALYDSVRAFSTRELPIFPTREAALDYLVSER